MRMWLVNPRFLCRKHLLGEHVEMHMFIGAIKKGISINGYIEKGLLETNRIISRHDELAEELIRRGYNHNSPVSSDFECPLPKGSVNIEKNIKELKIRCSDCCRLIELDDNLETK